MYFHKYTIFIGFCKSSCYLLRFVVRLNKYIQEVIFMSVSLRIVSSLEKIFPDQAPAINKYPLTVLQKDQVSFQLAVCPDYEGEPYVREEYHVALESPIADLISVRKVESVPVRVASHRFDDGNYISDKPGLYPDLLEPLQEGEVFYANDKFWSSLWIEVKTKEDTPAGEYPITIHLTSGEETFSVTTQVEVIGAVLPKQKLKHTKWFHCDGIAQYYNMEVWSEEYWEALEHWIRCAADMGINMLLTPIVTPALDTKIGKERLTTQLLDITVTNGEYTFDLTKLKRFVDICLKNGIEYFEMAHLFSQWGAKKTPKVMATVDGEYKRIFGWETDATSPEYCEYLHALLPVLDKAFEEWGIKDRVSFHISDEPSEEALPQYQACRDMVKDLLKDYTIMDAMSSYEFFKQGVCLCPVIATNHLDPFLNGEKPEEFWVYYCVGQKYKVSNGFIAMPSARTRIIGLQFYKYEVDGFLQWGYNFYNSQLSTRPINPYFVTDADGAFPAGDAFIVYPGPEGKPLESLRYVVFADALHDHRALALLESLTSREYVMSLIEEGLETPLSFSEYPHESEYLLRLMHRVHKEIKERI